MDYSQLPNDADHPAGESPWNTSPQPTRTSFAASQPSDNEPSMPSPEAHHASRGSPKASSTPHLGDERQEQRFSQAPTENGHGQQSPAPQDASDIYDRYKPAAIQYAQQARAGNTVRQQPGARLAQPPPQTPRSATHYKLQAKVTGLERTGRKDPILRFDVYVRRSCCALSRR